MEFRALKGNYYNKIFYTKDERKNHVEKIIKSEDYSKNINFNLGETLKEYRSFISNNKDININRLDSNL